jgi:hypothetical protein
MLENADQQMSSDKVAINFVEQVCPSEKHDARFSFAFILYIVMFMFANL